MKLQCGFLTSEKRIVSSNRIQVKDTLITLYLFGVFFSFLSHATLNTPNLETHTVLKKASCYTAALSAVLLQDQHIMYSSQCLQ